MTIRIIQMAFLALAVLVVGCGKDASTPVKVGVDGKLDPLTRGDSEALVVVNGKSITCGDFKKRLAIEKALYSLRFQRKGIQGADLEKRVAPFVVARERTLIPRLVNNVLVQDALAKAKLTLPEDQVKSTLKAACSGAGIKKVDLAALVEKLGVADADYLRRELLQEVGHKVLREHLFPESLTVSEKEIDEGLERQNKYYARAVASNAVTYVTCSNALAKINAGMDFAEAFRTFNAVDGDNSLEGEIFDLEDFETDVEALKPHMKRLKDWSLSAKIGSVSGPWEMEDGLAIVKIAAREDGAKDRSVVSLEDEAEVTLARIVFEMIEPEPEPRTREFVKESLLKWKADQAQRKMFEKLHAEMKLEYPLGTNFTFKVTKEK